MTDIFLAESEKDRANLAGYNDGLADIDYLEGSKSYAGDLVEHYRDGWRNGRIHQMMKTFREIIYGPPILGPSDPSRSSKTNS